LSTLAAIFFLFQAKVPCCAENRVGTFCRNNAWGLLGGCRIVQHRWQNVKLLIHRSSWGRFFRGVCSGGSRVAPLPCQRSARWRRRSSPLAPLVVATFAFLDPRAPR
jgi:hypothetical protein